MTENPKLAEGRLPKNPYQEFIDAGLGIRNGLWGIYGQAQQDMLKAGYQLPPEQPADLREAVAKTIHARERLSYGRYASMWVVPGAMFGWDELPENIKGAYLLEADSILSLTSAHEQKKLREKYKKMAEGVEGGGR